MDLLIKCPKQKNNATSSFTQKTHTFRLWPVCAFFLYTAKNHPYYSQNKCLKTPHCKLSILKLGKNTTFGSCRVCFSLHTLSKIFNLLFTSSKTPQHQAICSQTGKNATSRQLCRAVCSLHTLSKIFRLLFSQFKKCRNI